MSDLPVVVLTMEVARLTFDCRRKRGEGRRFAIVRGREGLLYVDEKGAMEGRGHGPAERRI